MIQFFGGKLLPDEKKAMRRVHAWVEALLRRVRRSSSASEYWKFYTRVFGYVRQLPASELKQIRLHTFHIDGHTYQNTFFTPKDAYRAAFSFVQEGLPARHRISAPKAAGEYGYLIDGKLQNDTTLQWQKFIRSIWASGALDRFDKRPAARPVFIEIGAGFGGLAHHFMRMYPKSLYVIVDLPETLFFSANYLSLVHGAERVLLACGKSDLRPERLKKASFVLVPNFGLDWLDDLRFDLALNVQSFQEMTARQVETYGSFLSRRASALVSWNADKNFFNREDVSVYKILEKYFELKPLPGFYPPPFRAVPALYQTADPPDRKCPVRTLIFGSGTAARRCASRLLETEKFRVVGFLDNNREKHGQTVDGIPIFDPARLKNSGWDYLYIASSYYPEIVTQLAAMGLKEIQNFSVFEEPLHPLPAALHRYAPFTRSVHADLLRRTIGIPKQILSR